MCLDQKSVTTQSILLPLDSDATVNNSDRSTAQVIVIHRIPLRSGKRSDRTEHRGALFTTDRVSYLQEGKIHAMNDATISRITVEQETDWLRVQDNFVKGLQASMEARLSSLPEGKDGPAAKAVRKELEYRLKMVRLQSCSPPGLTKQVTEETFRLAKPNLRVNGQDYEKYVECQSYPAERGPRSC